MCHDIDPLDMLISLKVEVQVHKIFCINKAMPTLPINIEDAARSEVEIEKALQVHLLMRISLSLHPPLFLLFVLYLP